MSKLFSFVLIALMFALPAQASNVYVAQAPGYAFITSNGTFDGLTVRMMKEISKITGIELNVVVTPSARLMAEMSNGKGDYMLFIKDERLNQAFHFMAVTGKSPLIAIPQRV